ncbi:MAG: carbonic anhydrase family protein [Candidatus Acidiferrales bacterium]
MTFILLVIAAVLAPVGPRAQWRTPWSYNNGADGPAHWGDLDPEYAACNGKEQSPIDIRNAKKSDLPLLRFVDKNGPLTIINNGYTALRVNYSQENGNFLIVGGQRYELTQFHFHHPSEEQIYGKPSDMVLHLMYKSSDGKVAGVAVLLKAGSANDVVQQLWEYMPKTAGKEHLIPGVEVNPAGLLPHDTAYYTYMGSVTAPPCTEGVKWFVLKAQMEVSPAQISKFAELYPHDVRPVQPLNGRVVEESQ